MIRRLTHNKISLALHTLRDGAGRPLLLLHGLAGRSPEAVPEFAEPWPGPVHALDFTGHGASTVPSGGGYTAELLMADADMALRSTGPATLLGHGLGAYVALLVAGARAETVRGAILCDGPGLAGGGEEPGTTCVVQAAPAAPGGDPAPDPFALAELAGDLRPADYALGYAHLAAALSGLDRPLSVCARQRPPWLRAVAGEPGVADTVVTEALDHYGRL